MIQWWCSATLGAAWSWEWRAYPGVWLFVALMAVVYIMTVTSVANRIPVGQQAASRKQMTMFAAGLGLIWLGTDWPVGALGAGYLLSAHQLQYVIYVMFAPPLILLGTPRWAWRNLTSNQRLRPVLSVVARPLVAVVISNTIILVTHVPDVVDGIMQSQLGTFVLDLSWLLAGFILWWPFLQRIPEFVPLSYPARFAYLIVASLLPGIPAVFLFFADYPIYGLYELAPRVLPISAVDDQFLGGAIMKIGTMISILSALTTIFFKWHSTDQAVDGALQLPRPLD